MRGWFERLPIHRKLVLSALLVTAVALVILTAGLAIADAIRFRTTAASEASALAQVLAENTAAAVAFEAPKLGLRAASVTVDHGLQADSAEVAARAARAAARLDLDPLVVRVEVGADGGPEAAARDARYRVLRDAARDARAAAVLVAHTLDDQAETVLLGLARGSGAGRSIPAVAASSFTASMKGRPR